MGTMTLWDRIWPWLRHPLSTAAATIAFRYVESHPDLEIHFAEHVLSDRAKYVCPICLRESPCECERNAAARVVST